MRALAEGAMGELHTVEVMVHFGNWAYGNLSGEIWAQRHFHSGQHPGEPMEAPDEKEPRG